MEPTTKDLKRFFDKVAVDDNTGCWIWKGCYSKGFGGSYGRFRYLGLSQRAHRIAFMFFVRSLQEGEQVHHRCGTCACVNPKHLEVFCVGSHQRHHRVED